MAIFKDEKDRSWSIDLTIGAVRKVQKLLSVNLLDLESGKPPLLTRLGTDLMLLVDVIYVLVKDQTDKANVSDEEFGLALNGEAASAAQEAFYEELVLFFRGLGRKDMALALETQMKIIHQAVELVEKKLAGIDVEKQINLAFGKESTDSLGQ